MKLPKDLRYTESHEWLRRESDGTFTVGITDHAQEQLGDIVFVLRVHADQRLCRAHRPWRELALHHVVSPAGHLDADSSRAGFVSEEVLRRRSKRGPSVRGSLLVVDGSARVQRKVHAKFTAPLPTRPSPRRRGARDVASLLPFARSAWPLLHGEREMALAELTVSGTTL